MLLKRFRKTVAAVILLLFSSASWGLIIPNPNPALLGDDINGNGLFIPGELTFNIEIFDTLEYFGLLGSEFGFYYGSNPDLLYPIFEVTDQSPGQWATVNFNSGGVLGSIFDGDEGTIQSLFPTQGTDPVGFYLELNSVLGKATYGDDIIYTQANLNPLGEDMAAEFPSLGPFDAFLIAFADINITNGRQDGLGYYLVAPLSEVPVPGALGLWLLGLAGIELFRRKLRAV